MWKKIVSSAVITLALFLGLNLYISSSLSTLIKEESQKAVEKLDSNITLQMGPVESSPFRGNIDLIDVYYHHSGTQSTVELDRFSLDLSYIDFLRLYFFGLQTGMKEITRLDFSVARLQLRELTSLPNMTAGSITSSYSGSLWQLLQLAANKKLPGSSAQLALEVQDMRMELVRKDTTYEPLSISRGLVKATYQGNFKLATIEKFELSGPELNAESNGRITFDTRSRTLQDITDVQLDLSLDYQNKNGAPLPFKTEYGSISFGSLALKSSISTVDNSDFDLTSWQSWGESSTLNAQDISLGLPPGNEQNISSLVLQTLFGSSALITLDQFRLETESDRETLTVPTLLIDHQAFDINGRGTIEKKSSPAQSEFRDFTVSLTEMQPDFRNMVSNMSQMLGIQFASGSGSLSINLKGRLGKPRISK